PSLLRSPHGDDVFEHPSNDHTDKSPLKRAPTHSPPPPFSPSSRSIAPPSALYALRDSPVPSRHVAHSQCSHVQTCFRASASTSRSRRRRSISFKSANTVGGSNVEM